MLFQRHAHGTAERESSREKRPEIHCNEQYAGI
jgi:hypothetical protein